MKDQKYVEGLRGGAVVLIVASFENYIRQLMEEHLAKITVQPIIVAYNKLPNKMQVQNVYGTLENAMKSPKYQPPTQKIDRLPIIDSACRHVISGVINPKAFSDTASNPNTDVVKNLFNNVGVENIFDKIKVKFEKKWKQPVAVTFIADKLSEIVIRRHVVAHRVNALNITRKDISQSIKFMVILAELLNKELDAQIKNIMPTP